MKVLFVSGFGPIVREQKASESLYLNTLGLTFTRNNDYLFTDKLDGVKHFALWPLAGAAQSCFGTDTWPEDIPVPQAWMEFDVEDVEAASKELQQNGYRLLVSNRTEPWGQIITRLMSPEGILLGIGFTPWMR